MNNLNLLIENLCPKGVKFIPLKDAAKMQRGTAITKKDIKDGPFPVVAGGQKPAYYCDSYNRDGETITVAGSGAYAGYIAYWNEPIFVSDAFSIKGNSNACTRYLFYVLQNLQEKIYATKKGGGVPHVHIVSIENFRISLPPLPVQREIVRILDNFTELTAELTAELAARRKQYEFYRDKLLTSTNGLSTQSLGDVCNVIAGGTPSKKNSNFWDGGTIKWLGSTVCQNQKTVDSITDYITEEGLASSSAKIMRKDTTLIALVGATIGKIAFLPFEAAINQNIVGVYPKDTTVLDPSYVYYACTALYPRFLALTQGSKLAMANLSFVRGLQIPVPPLNVQKRIVNVLDNFDTICSDLNVGLPAEIEARQKQYEYYRDKLLTFKEITK